LWYSLRKLTHWRRRAKYKIFMDEKLAWMEKKDKSRIEKEKEEEKRNE